jgi:valyl-tRNA synthetase
MQMTQKKLNKKEIDNLIESLLTTQYDASKVENKILQFWEENKINEENIYEYIQENEKEKFVVVLPPPNVTGVLHIGHIFEHSLSDFLIRYNKLCGLKVIWIPGTDHASIATQNVVVKNLAKQGIKKEIIGKEKFLEYVWEWVKKCESEIINQCKRTGNFLNWQLYAFTMDEKRSAAVAYAFEKLYNDGLIYKDKYIVNFCVVCQTALSDDEVEYNEVKTKLYYIRYPVVGETNKYITIATTRPETILADVAVAFHPSDTRYTSYIGKKVLLPIVNRELPIIQDNYVDPKFGTGALKITPAHDFTDYTIGKKHNLPMIEVINNRGRMNENGASYQGMDRFECRKKIVEDLKKGGYIEKIEDYTTRLGSCYRCNSIIEPTVSWQWFVKMRPLAEMVKKSYLKGEFEIIPKKFESTFLYWLDNIRDWCISRQLWWGHQIPYYTCQNCNFSFAKATKIGNCPKCNSNKLVQEEDVLDTWFSSWLWPLSTTGWLYDEKLFAKLYPTDTLISGREILFFWDIRMLMAGLYFTGKVPFKKLLLHGIVRDEQHRKMSKTLGNSPDINKILEQFGADATRAGFLLNASFEEDFIFSHNIFPQAKHFSNKMWNALKFFIMHAKNLNYQPKKIQVSTPNLNDHIIKWIYTQFYETITQIKDVNKTYDFLKYSRTLYKFFWNTFCDWYIEITKEKIKNGHTIYIDVGLDIIERFIIYWHPVQPFITELIYQTIQNYTYPSKEIEKSIVNEKLPTIDKNLTSPTSVTIMENVIKLEEFFRIVKQYKKTKGKGNFTIYTPNSNISSSPIHEIIELVKNFEIIQIRNEKPPIFYQIEISDKQIIYIELENDKEFLKFLLTKTSEKLSQVTQKQKEIEKKLEDLKINKIPEKNLIEKYTTLAKEVENELSLLDLNIKNLTQAIENVN